MITSSNANISTVARSADELLEATITTRLLQAQVDLVRNINSGAYRFIYYPRSSGQDEFTYTLSQGGQSDTATVFISVNFNLSAPNRFFELENGQTQNQQLYTVADFDSNNPIPPRLEILAGPAYGIQQMGEINGMPAYRVENNAGFFEFNPQPDFTYDVVYTSINATNEGFEYRLEQAGQTAIGRIEVESRFTFGAVDDAGNAPEITPIKTFFLENDVFDRGRPYEVSFEVGINDGYFDERTQAEVAILNTRPEFEALYFVPRDTSKAPFVQTRWLDALTPSFQENLRYTLRQDGRSSNANIAIRYEPILQQYELRDNAEIGNPWNGRSTMPPFFVNGSNPKITLQSDGQLINEQIQGGTVEQLYQLFNGTELILRVTPDGRITYDVQRTTQIGELFFTVVALIDNIWAAERVIVSVSEGIVLNAIDFTLTATTNDGVKRTPVPLEVGSLDPGLIEMVFEPGEQRYVPLPGGSIQVEQDAGGPALLWEVSRDAIQETLQYKLLYPGPSGLVESNIATLNLAINPGSSANPDAYTAMDLVPSDFNILRNDELTNAANYEVSFEDADEAEPGILPAKQGFTHRAYTYMPLDSVILGFYKGRTPEESFMRVLTREPIAVEELRFTYVLTQGEDKLPSQVNVTVLRPEERTIRIELGLEQYDEREVQGIGIVNKAELEGYGMITQMELTGDPVDDLTTLREQYQTQSLNVFGIEVTNNRGPIVKYQSFRTGTDRISFGLKYKGVWYKYTYEYVVEEPIRIEALREVGPVEAGSDTKRFYFPVSSTMPTAMLTPMVSVEGKGFMEEVELADGAHIKPGREGDEFFVDYTPASATRANTLETTIQYKVVGNGQESNILSGTLTTVPVEIKLEARNYFINSNTKGVLPVVEESVTNPKLPVELRLLNTGKEENVNYFTEGKNVYLVKEFPELFASITVIHNQALQVIEYNVISSLNTAGGPAYRVAADSIDVSKLALATANVDTSKLVLSPTLSDPRISLVTEADAERIKLAGSLLAFTCQYELKQSTVSSIGNINFEIPIYPVVEIAGNNTPIKAGEGAIQEVNIITSLTAEQLSSFQLYFIGQDGSRNTSLTTPLGGRVTRAKATTTYTYTAPAETKGGTDAFQIVLSNGVVESNIATVSFVVTQQEIKIIAKNYELTGNANHYLNVENDSITDPRINASVYVFPNEEYMRSEVAITQEDKTGILGFQFRDLYGNTVSVTVSEDNPKRIRVGVESKSYTYHGTGYYGTGGPFIAIEPGQPVKLPDGLDQPTGIGFAYSFEYEIREGEMFDRGVINIVHITENPYYYLVDEYPATPILIADPVKPVPVPLPDAGTIDPGIVNVDGPFEVYQPVYTTMPVMDTATFKEATAPYAAMTAARSADEMALKAGLNSTVDASTLLAQPTTATLETYKMSSELKAQ